MISDLKLHKEKIIKVDNGNLFHFIKQDSSGYHEFGECYFSEVKYKKIKGWKKHNIMKMNLAVPYGRVRIVFYDDRYKNNQGIFQEIFLSPSEYYRVSVPPQIWFAFQGLNDPTSLLVNLSNIKHDPDEVSKCNLENIKFKW